eukprot:7387174-Prymnesium_polylepis.1
MVDRAEKLKLSLERRGLPEPPPRPRGNSSLFAEGLSQEEWLAAADSIDARRGAFAQACEDHRQ